VLGFSLFLSTAVSSISKPAGALLFVAWGLLIGSICLLLGGRYAGRASARRHVRAAILRGAHRDDSSPDDRRAAAADFIASLDHERAEQRFATVYDWLIASAEALFAAGIICAVVFAALCVVR